ncbi:MAG: hypothetical protein AAGC57_16140 [Pseudomonadota bacterium]
MMDVLYLSIAGAGLVALCAVLVVIGRAAAECPMTAAAARLGTWVVTTGFAAFGIGAIGLIGAALPVLSRVPASALYAAVGMVAIALGFGFYQAAVMLRGLMRDARAARDEAAAPPKPAAA